MRIVSKVEFDVSVTRYLINELLYDRGFDLHCKLILWLINGFYSKQSFGSN